MPRRSPPAKNSKPITKPTTLLSRYADGKRSFRGANLGHADLIGANLAGVDLTDANLAGAHLFRADLTAATLRRADLRGANLSRATLTLADLRDATMEESDLSGANLLAANLRDAYINGAHMVEANLRGADITSAELNGVDLTEASLYCVLAFGVDMRDAELGEANLHWAQLRGANLQRSRFGFAHLGGADLAHSNLSETNLTHTHLVAANLAGSNLTKAYVTHSDLSDANLTGSILNETRFESVLLARTILADVDLSEICHASDSLTHNAPSIVDIRSVARSARSPGLDSFLRRTGMPGALVEAMLECAKTLDSGNGIHMIQSTFISYGSPDERFARKLYAALHRNGVRAFLFALHAVPGEKLHNLMRKGVNEHDRVILICSRASLDRKGVLNEIEETLAREARDGGASYLIPVRLDDYVLSEWKPVNSGAAQAVRDRVVADFTNAMADSKMFDEGVARLLNALSRP